MMTNPDKFLYVNWEDDRKNTYRIGILARINGDYYLKTQYPNQDGERNAHSHGFAGIPGFANGRLYKSTNDLFDFFKDRIYPGKIENRDSDILEELMKTEGKTVRDSFFIEEMPDILIDRCKEVLLAINREDKKVNKTESKKTLNTDEYGLRD